MSAAPIAAPGKKTVEQIEKSREVRLGLVMYGGVSLAIYINGVAHELFRAVRGRGVYRMIKRLTRSDVSVDVLSGTSAGGINGIFLAYALCNEVEFGECAALWRQHGDIDKLLRPVDAPDGAYSSLLDSEGFYQPRLVEAFQAMAESPCTKFEGLEEKTEVPELDLLVTGTDFNGRIYDTTDDRSQVVQVKNHRALFWLKHRARRKQPFHGTAILGDAPREGLGPNPQTHEALAKLARITSCFPAAFAPVTVTAEGRGADARLRFWGALEPGRDCVFIDGGVLDNKPFTSTLDAIYHRTADKPVERRLLFVEPDPEQFDPDAIPVVPSMVRAALDSLIRLPGYESIAEDLASLGEHNDQVDRLKEIARAARKLPAPEPQAKKIVDEVYRRARLNALAEGMLGELFQRPPRDAAGRDAIEKLRQWFREQVVEKEGLGEKFLETYDVDLRLRRLLILTYACESELLDLKALLKTLNNQVQVLEMIRGAMRAAVAKVTLDQDPAKTWAQVHEAVRRVATVPPPADYARLDPKAILLDEAAREAFKTQLDAAGSATGAPTGPETLLEVGDAFLKGLLAAAAALSVNGAKLVASDNQFERRDAAVFPLEVVSGIRERDIIRTVRISPIDAQEGASKRSLAQKVTGVNVGHFAAFFKRSWRSNDILWGRLDGACELVDILLDEERVWTLATRGQWVLPSSDELDDYLPQLGPQDRTTLGTAFKSLSGLLEELKAELGKTGKLTEAEILGKIEPKLRSVKLLLIDAAHAEILAEGLPQVIEDAAGEQMLWNEYSGRTIEGPRGKKGAASRFVAGTEALDPAVIAEASAEIAKASIKKMAEEQPPTTLVAQFKARYRVGEETMDDIPRVVLLDIIARALLVVRNSLLQAAGPRAEKLTGTLVYKALLDWPLRLLAALAGGLRRAPSGRRGVIVGALLYAALSGAVVYKTRLDFGKLEGLGAGLFVGLPVLLLGASSFLMAVRNGASLKEHVGQFLWTVVKLTGLVAVVGVLAALCLAPSHDLCVSVRDALPEYLRFECGHALESLTTAGKVLVIGAVLLTPLAWIWAGGRRLSARRQEAQQKKEMLRKKAIREASAMGLAAAAEQRAVEVGVVPRVM